jgi:UDP-N-acetylglucosamine 2-epimerase (non-hydrolysing)
MKVAPILDEMRRCPGLFEPVLVHTGQHYDDCMSGTFFDQLGLPKPDDFLNVGPGSHAQQTARIMAAFEPAVLRHNPAWVVVVGDVNSTLACALVFSKLSIKVAHVEAGLRSGDRSMPEEINRILTDQIADLLLTPSPDADANLFHEGIPPEKIRFVGNVMIDSLVKMLPLAARSQVLDELGLKPRCFALATLHRPGNVDQPDTLRDLLSCLVELAADIPLVFPVHPRTRQRIADLRFTPPSNLMLVDPLDYISFLALMRSARMVVTDSGGVQEETTYLGVPCLTMRPNTERPVTVVCGTNRLVAGTAELMAAARQVLAQGSPRKRMPELWDGKTAGRIVQALAEAAAEENGVVSSFAGVR